ncbi:MAG: hypothetical protein Ct9H90mP9_0240 [Pseudomonadota bacterium]|nr:MAG: hypothetical protein Ct9H90mP9_0240 [Pseudomonadota bacterium]
MAFKKPKGSVDSYDGVIDSGKMAREFLRSEFGVSSRGLGKGITWCLAEAVLTSSAELFPKGIATKIALELASEGALKRGHYTSLCDRS